MQTPVAVADHGNLTTRARAQIVAGVAAQYAGPVDVAARFPVEAIAAVKQHRLLGLLVPTELGGEGASISEVADVCYQLAQGCSATGMIYAMHQVKVACVVRHMHENPTLQHLMRQLCADQLLLASSTTEGTGGGNVRASEAPVVHEGDKITLERRATVISYGAFADGIVTTARRSAEAAANDQVLIMFLKENYTLSPLQGWQTLGMRGTCSEGYLLKARAPAGHILPQPYEVIHAHTMVPCAHLFWGSVWAGIAASAVARAQGFIRQVLRQSNGQLPPGAPEFTKALASLRTLRGMLANALRTYEQQMNDPKSLSAMEFQSMITLTKVEASELAVSIVLMALRVCGLSGYRTDTEFSVERQLRDVLSAPLMINNDRILANLATPSVLAPIPAGISD